MLERDVCLQHVVQAWSMGQSCKSLVGDADYQRGGVFLN